MNINQEYTDIAAQLKKRKACNSAVRGDYESGRMKRLFGEPHEVGDRVIVKSKGKTTALVEVMVERIGVKIRGTVINVHGCEHGPFHIETKVEFPEEYIHTVYPSE